MTSPLDDYLDQLRSTLHVERREAAELVDQLHRAADAYLRAVEWDAARRFAEKHSLPKPASTHDLLAMATALRRLVDRLPGAPTAPPSAVPATAVSRPASEAPPAPTPRPTVVGDHPQLQAAAADGRPIVVVGGSARRHHDDGIPPALQAHVEWIDTTGQGTHAIGNLEKRIRDGRLAALVVLEGMVSHKHSTPLIQAARATGLPHAYGARGGRATFRRVFAELERSLTLT